MKRKVIFFIDGPAPTAADQLSADSLVKPRTNIVFRNAQYIVAGEALETCDAVAGCVPELYAKWPREDAAVAAPIITSTEIVNQSSVTKVQAIASTEEINAFAALSINTVLAQIEAGDITKEKAVELENLGKGRKSLLARLAE